MNNEYDKKSTPTPMCNTMVFGIFMVFQTKKRPFWVFCSMGDYLVSNKR